MQAAIARTVHLIDDISEWSGRAIAWLTLAMVLVTFAVVVLRYLFNLGWIWMQESITYMHAAVFLLGAAFTLRRDGHVRVDIFYREMSPRRQALVNLFGTLCLLLPTVVFLFWVGWDYVLESWAVLEGSREAGGIPGVFLLKTAMLLMAAQVILQGLADLLRSLLTLTGHPVNAKDGED